MVVVVVGRGDFLARSLYSSLEDDKISACKAHARFLDDKRQVLVYDAFMFYAVQFELPVVGSTYMCLEDCDMTIKWNIQVVFTLEEV
ncbi:hypothetical protein V2J09_024297 [Rumex salicifolius]